MTLSDFITARAGTQKWCVAPRLTERLKIKGYERAIHQKTYSKWVADHERGDDPCGPKVTNIDRDFLKKIDACGFVGVTLDAQLYLECNAAFGKWRFDRLVERGFLEPANDGLFAETPQSWRLTDKGRRYAHAPACEVQK